MPSRTGQASVLALAVMGLLPSSCTAARNFGVSPCVDETPRLVNCECSPAGRTLTHNLRATTAREYTSDGEPTERVYEVRRPMSIVLRGYWLLVGVSRRSAGAASAATWLRCGNCLIAGQAIFPCP